MNIQELTQPGRDAMSVISDLKQKTITIPSWTTLKNEYDPKMHPVMTDVTYRDKYNKKTGQIEKVTRIALGLQKLAVKRMTELMFAIPVHRVYSPQNDAEKKVAEIMEAIFKKNRIDSVNNERGRCLFASCECVTLWYSQEKDTVYAGEKSKKFLQ